MINISPTKRRELYQYSSRNKRLMTWTVLLFIALIGLILLSQAGISSIQRETQKYEQQISATNKIYQAENLGSTQKEIQSMQNSINLANKVLSQEIRFSEVFKKITASIPDKAKLSSLTVNKSQGAIDITASAPDYNTATQLQVNLSDKNNKVFSKADIVNISCNGGRDKTGACTVTVRALFSKNNPYLVKNKGTN
ncbi:hypothetical protein EBZ57_01660 [bacterium]|nr:hypothetical protein [bacterium]